jgi:hypothetical protein
MSSSILELFIVSGDRVIIDGGFIAETRIISASGTTRIKHPPGTYRYYVDVVEADGGIIGMWDGGTYTEAFAAAKTCSVSWDNAPIIDRVRA